MQGDWVRAVFPEAHKKKESWASIKLEIIMDMFINFTTSIHSYYIS